jgi:hypothetical protein
MKPTLRKNVAAAMLLLAPLGAALVAQPAAAQYAPQYRVAQVAPGRITNMALNSDAGLRPGATLRLQVYGTPDARFATATLGDSGVRIALRERAPGEYVGTHVIRRGDRIDPRQAVTVRAGWGEGPVAVAFDYPASFQALAMGAGPAVAAPEVDSFVADLGGRLEPGRVLHFRLLGTPGSRVTLNIPKTVRNMPLRETQPGVYEASYTIRRSDDPIVFHDTVASLRTGERHVVARLNIDRHRDRVGAAGDTTPPRIVDITPANGDRLTDSGRQTRLSARLSDDGSGIDPASLRLRINGRDVTRDARIRDDEVRYREDLPRGRHTVELAVRDKAGNASRTTWTFEVV